MKRGPCRSDALSRWRRAGRLLPACLAAGLAVAMPPVLAQPAPGQAEPRLGFSLAHYERTLQRQDPTATKMLYWYLDGVLTGFMWHFADHRVRAQPAFFCLPDGVGMTVEEIQASIAAELAARGAFWRRTPDVPVERIALHGMKRRFPCPLP